jgi:hypothetical protein
VIPIVLYGYALHSSQASFIPMSAFTPKADIDQLAPHVRFVPILLQKSQIAERQFFRQKTRQAVIAD